MAVAAMKHMASNFAKLNKFEGMDFRRWQKKMHFLLSIISVVYVITTPISEDGENATDSLEAKYMDEDASRKKFVVSNFTDYKMNDSRPVMEHYNELLGILGRSLTLVELDYYLHIEESLRAQVGDKPKGNNVVDPSVFNMVEHKNSFRYNDNKGKRKHQDTKADPNKKSKVTCWKCGKSGHLKKDCKGGKVGNKANGSGINGLVNGSSNSLKGETVHVCKDRCWFKTYETLNDGSILHMGNKINIGNDNIASAFMSTSKLNDSILWHARLGHEHFKRMQDMSKKPFQKCKTCMLTKITKKPFQNVKCETKVLELTHSDLSDLHATPSLGNRKYFVTFIDDTSRVVVRLPDPKLKSLGERGIECIFAGYVEHPKAFSFYVIEPNESRSLINGAKDIGGLVVPREVIEEVMAQQLELELRKSKRNRTPKNFRPKFHLYLIEGIRDEKEAVNDEMDFIMGNNTWVLADLPLCCKPLVCKWIFKRKLKVDETIEKFKARLVNLTKEFLSSNFSRKDMVEADDIIGIRIKHESNRIEISQSHYFKKVLKKFNYFDCTPMSTPMDTSEKMLPNNGQVVSQLEYSRVTSCMMYAMTCTRPDIAFIVGKLILEGYTDASWISNNEANLSTSGWVFLLGRGAISWASKKQTCITSSTMESEFVALVAIGKEAEWLRNLILEISLWSKSITPISIFYDSAATLARAYSQMYNKKSRHLGIRHSIIHELMMNGLLLREYKAEAIRLMNIISPESHSLTSELTELHQRLEFLFTTIRVKVLSDLWEYTSYLQSHYLIWTEPTIELNFQQPSPI
ncbi:zinc finger, CCHC-type containing protein [Tanacetum coccineum]